MAREIATGGIEDNGNYTSKSGGANPPQGSNGNHPHNLPNFNANRTDFSNRKTLLNGGAEKVLINQGLSGAEPGYIGENNSLHVNITT